MKYFTNSMTLDEVKAAYRKQAMQLHPDRGGSVQAMQELNNEFEIAFAIALVQQSQQVSPRYTKKSAQPAETARGYRRQFYTVNGWQGSRYDRDLSTKDIAQLIRKYVKTVYPTYRFSITSTFSTINVALTEYPVELTNRELLRTYYHISIHSIPVYIPSKGYINANDTTEADREEWISYRIETAGCKKNFDASNTWINPLVFAVLKDIQDFMNSYNYDDSDSMTDYFNSNFYGFVQIGKDGRPAKLVGRTARISQAKQTKKAQRLTA